MVRFLLGILIGAAATAAWLKRQESSRGLSSTLDPRTEGRVDELSSAAANPAAMNVNAGDGTPGRR